MGSFVPKSEDYRDYVIKNGKFIGAFEEMYQNCEDPWNQDTNQTLAQDLALAMISRLSQKRVLDIGCGKGRFTSRIGQATKAEVIGLDAAPTAIKIARSRYPALKFEVANCPPIPFPDENFDFVVIGEIIWYVLPRLEELFQEVERILSAGGYLLIVQQFYSPEEQTYGKDIMRTPQDLLKKIKMKPVHIVETDKGINLKLTALFQKGKVS